MSPPGRPKGEYRSAKHEGSTLSPPGRPKGEYRSAKHGGLAVTAPRPRREAFAHRQHIHTRWTDNDIYGHVNNAIYYQYFDSVINAYLIAQGGLDIHRGAVVGFIVNSSCEFYAPVSYPDVLEVGVLVHKLGRSSVTYQTALFTPGRDEACACGQMVHVFVGTADQRPVEMPPDLRAALARLMPAESAATGEHVRPFVDADEAAVIALWVACGLTRPWNDPRRDIQRKRQVQPELFLVGVQDSRVVATAMGGYDGHRGWVNYLAVHPDVQRAGWGRRLMAQLEAQLTARGCPKLNLQVRADNAAAVAFYERLGYGQDAVLSMGKRLVADEPRA